MTDVVTGEERTARDTATAPGTGHRYEVVEYHPVIVRSFESEQEARDYFNSPEYMESPTEGADMGGYLADTHTNAILDRWF